MNCYRNVILSGWWVILLVLAVGVLLLGPWVPKLDVHTSTEVLLGESDPDLAYYERTRPLWGYDEYAIVCVTRDDWFDPESVALLQELVAELEAAPDVEKVTTILGLPLLRQATGSPIDILSGFKTLESDGIDHDLARGEVLSHTQALGNLISADGRSLSLLVYLDVPAETKRLDPILSDLRGRRLTDPEAAAEMERLRPEVDASDIELTRRRLAMVERVREIAAAWSERLGEPVRLSGISIININLTEHLRHDLQIFGIASLVLFTLAFALVYRKSRFVWMPMIACTLPVILVVGAMSWLGVKVTIMTANLPLLLFTLMLPYAVYFIERYRERRWRNPEESGAESTVTAAVAIWPPCLFSCTTTMAGFAALLTSDTQPVHDLGLFMVIGMGLGLVIVFLAMPSMSRPLPALAVPKPSKANRGRVVQAFERITLKAPGAVLIASAILLGLAIWGATKVSAQSKFTEYFRGGSEVYEGLEYIDREMGGTTPLEIILESDQKGFFFKPEGLAALEAAAHYFEAVPETGNVRSLATMVDELEKKNEHIVKLLPFFAHHPKVREAVADLANEDYTVARVLIRLQETAPTLDRTVILDGLRRHLASQPELEGLEVRETGVFLLYANMLDSLIRTQKRTFGFVVLAIFLMLLVLFRSIPLSFLVLLPQVLPALVTLGAMGWFGIPLDLVTVVIASIAMGIGIDAAIQYTFRFRIELEKDGDRRAALHRAHGTIGRSIWIATSVIIAGFLILVLSDFRPSIWFGLFTAIAMLVSQIAALTTLPAIFLLTGYPKAPKQ